MAASLESLDLAAASYVEEHHLEEHLSAAVDLAIQQKSSDPLTVIAEFLTKLAAVKADPTIRTHDDLGAGKKGAGGGRMHGPLSLELHTKARSQDNPSYPTRLPVSDDVCRWSEAWTDYVPPTWTHEIVLANTRDMPSSQGWADPPTLAELRSELEARTTFATGNGVPEAMGTALLWDEKTGAPLNPVGRTGLQGRGLLGKWGANHAADPIVTRFHPRTGQLQVVAIQRKDTGQWAIPGGMVDPGENVSVTVKREFTEEAGAISDEAERQEFLSMTEELFSSGKQVYRGYVDDPRSTDNAWLETTAFHFHCSEKIASKLPLKAGDDAGQVMWLDVSMANETYRNLYGAHRALIDEAVFAAWSRAEFKCSIVEKTG